MLTVIVFVVGAVAGVLTAAAILFFLVIRRALREIKTLREDSARAARLFAGGLRARHMQPGGGPHDVATEDRPTRADR